MPLAVNAVVGAGATGPALPAPLPGGAAQQISNIVGTLISGAMFGAPLSHIVPDMFGWRIDRQNAPAGEVNISVQRNGVGAPSTVASVFVPGTLNVAPTANGAVNQARNGELQRAVRRGLEQSFASYAAAPVPPGGTVITRFRVTGNYSA